MLSRAITQTKSTSVMEAQIDVSWLNEEKISSSLRLKSSANQLRLAYTFPFIDIAYMLPRTVLCNYPVQNLEPSILRLSSLERTHDTFVMQL